MIFHKNVLRLFNFHMDQTKVNSLPTQPQVQFLYYPIQYKCKPKCIQVIFTKTLAKTPFYSIDKEVGQKIYLL